VPQKINRLIKARVKRCGKSTPALLATKSAWKTPLKARPSRDDIVMLIAKSSLWLVIRVGRSSFKET